MSFDIWWTRGFELHDLKPHSPLRKEERALDPSLNGLGKAPVRPKSTHRPSRAARRGSTTAQDCEKIPNSGRAGASR
jgi:hypothetical protein